jgi:hypothetical protein
MSAYEKDIIEVTGCSPDDAAMIEHIMREEVFHSTLDWQTAAQFNRAARKAAKILAADRGIYEEYFRLTREAYERMRAESQAMRKGELP